MMTFISCAKTMTARSKIHTPGTSVPRFEKEAEANALHMAQFSPEQLGKLLRVNPKLAAETACATTTSSPKTTARFRL